jgi:hypothetical protein
MPSPHGKRLPPTFLETASSIASGWRQAGRDRVRSLPVTMEA